MSLFQSLFQSFRPFHFRQAKAVTTFCISDHLRISMTRQNCNWLLLGWAELGLQCLLLLLPSMQSKQLTWHTVATIPASGGQMRFLYDVWSLAGQCRRWHSSRMANKGGVTRLSEAAVAGGQCKMDMIMIWLWYDYSMIWIYIYIYEYDMNVYHCIISPQLWSFLFFSRLGQLWGPLSFPDWSTDSSSIFSFAKFKVCG